MKELSIAALMLMEGQQVIVKDLAYDNIFGQVCTIKIKYKYIEKKTSKCSKFVSVVEKLWLENDEYIFEYDELGHCTNGEFKVYALRKKEESI